MDNQDRQKVLVFALDEQLFALPLLAVSRVVRIVAITEVPGLPSYISGVVNVHGKMIPVINLRLRMNMSDKPTHMNDQMIIVELTGYSYILHVDNDTEVVEISDQMEGPTTHSRNDQMFFEGVFQLKQGVVLLCKPDAFLSKQDFEVLEDVIKKVDI